MLYIAFLCFCFPCFGESLDTRLPSPAEADQQSAEALLMEFYAEEFKLRAANERLAFARELLRQGDLIKSDTSAAYVVYRKCLAWATELNDFDTAMRAVDRLSERFEIEARAMRYEALLQIARSIKQPEAAKSMAAHFQQLAEHACQENDYAQGATAALKMQEMATISRDSDLFKEAKNYNKEIAARKLQYEKFLAATAKLKADPRDATALKVAVTHCLN
jgi:hypothetical protein